MNHLLWPTLGLAAVLFWLGGFAERRLSNPKARLAFLTAALLASIPAISFAAYYTKLLGEPVWLYRFRALPASELSAAGLGLLGGFVHHARRKHSFLKRQLRAFTVPAIFSLILISPYAKPIIRPLDARQLQDRWDDDVCLQSTPSTCGPASAATIARCLGRALSEADLARESHTHAGGTENWYLTRSLRKHGFNVELVKIPPTSESFPTSAVAGVKLAQGTGHFIALLGRRGTNYLVGDPLVGKLTASLAELRTDYRFTGFFLVIK